MNPGLFSPFVPRTNSPSTGVPLYVRQIVTSQTWKAPCDGYVEFLVFGAGGSGALSLQNNVDTRAQGGCAGGTAYKRVKVQSGNTYSITIGAGGPGRSAGSAVALAGASGGETSIVGPECFITIPGGLGGAVLASSTTTLSKLTRSTPSGGDVNIPGGVSGGITIGSLGTSGNATGGGGPGLFSLENDSGDITVTSARGAATGGAGMLPSGALSSGNATGGGGSLEPSALNSFVGGAGALGFLSGSSYGNISNLFYYSLALTGAGTNAVETNNISSGSTGTDVWGAGSGGVSAGDCSSTVTSGVVTFGGSGAIATNSTLTGASVSTGLVKYCGGSGGNATTDAQAGSAWTTGAGGQGLAFIAFFAGY